MPQKGGGVPPLGFPLLSASTLPLFSSLFVSLPAISHPSFLTQWILNFSSESSSNNIENVHPISKPWSCLSKNTNSLCNPWQLSMQMSWDFLVLLVCAFFIWYLCKPLEFGDYPEISTFFVGHQVWPTFLLVRPGAGETLEKRKRNKIRRTYFEVWGSRDLHVFWIFSWKIRVW